MALFQGFFDGIGQSGRLDLIYSGRLRTSGYVFRELKTFPSLTAERMGFGQVDPESLHELLDILVARGLWFARCDGEEHTFCSRLVAGHHSSDATVTAILRRHFEQHPQFLVGELMGKGALVGIARLGLLKEVMSRLKGSLEGLAALQERHGAAKGPFRLILALGIEEATHWGLQHPNAFEWLLLAWQLLKYLKKKKGEASNKIVDLEVVWDLERLQEMVIRTIVESKAPSEVTDEDIGTVNYWIRLYNGVVALFSEETTSQQQHHSSDWAEMISRLRVLGEQFSPPPVESTEEEVVESYHLFVDPQGTCLHHKGWVLPKRIRHHSKPATVSQLMGLLEAGLALDDLDQKMRIYNPTHLTRVFYDPDEVDPETLEQAIKRLPSEARVSMEILAKEVEETGE